MCSIYRRTHTHVCAVYIAHTLEYSYSTHCTVHTVYLQYVSNTRRAHTRTRYIYSVCAYISTHILHTLEHSYSTHCTYRISAVYMYTHCTVRTVYLQRMCIHRRLRVQNLRIHTSLGRGSASYTRTRTRTRTHTHIPTHSSVFSVQCSHAFVADPATGAWAAPQVTRCDRDHSEYTVYPVPSHAVQVPRCDRV